MADLENLLLEAAGRKPSGSQVPLKKRFDSKGRGGAGGDDDDNGSDDESDIGDDLYKNDDDRKKLAEMTEFEREMILSDRASKKDDKGLLGKITLKRDKANTIVSRKETPPPLPVRSSMRSADRSTAKDDALNGLRAKRLKQNQDNEAQQRRLKEASRTSMPGQFSPKHKPLPSTSPSGESESDSESESESRSRSRNEGSNGDQGIIYSDDDGVMSGFEVPLFEDIKEITIPRSKLAKWFMEPFFEELIVGCFVRVGIGRSKSRPIYRLCIVKNVDASDRDRLYKFENKTTYKYLNVIWGNETSAARWQLAMVSDSPPLEEEFKQWVKEVERSGGRMPTKQDVLGKKQAIKNINSFVYSAATVKHMLEEKKSASRRPLNIAAEKDRLRRQLEIAQSKDDEAEVERIKTRLQELEASRQAQKMDAKALKLAEMNRKNRFENFKNASKLKPVNTGLKAGEAGYDPFSRRWTRSRNYYASKPGEEAAAAGGNSASGAVADAGRNGKGTPVVVEAGMVATAAALEAAAGAGKLVDTSAPVDQGTESNVLHNFELPISLAMLQKFGGAQGARAGYMARKQRIEATVGVQVPENDGKRHPMTLTVSDYKRRRGLL